MTRVVRVVAFAATLMFVLSASAAERTGFYGGLRLIGSGTKAEDGTATGFTGTLVSNHSDDLVGGAAAFAGYAWMFLPIRTEIEGGQRFRFDFDNRDPGPPIIGYDNNVATTAVLFNLLLEYRNKSSFTPFAGGTVGWARNRSETLRTNVATSSEVDQTNDVDNVAWGLMAGFTWDFVRHWGAELAYRYIHLGEASTGTFAGGDSVETDDILAHELLMSVLYRF